MAVLSWWRRRALITLVAFSGWKPQVVFERSCSVAFFSCSVQTAVLFSFVQAAMVVVCWHAVMFPWLAFFSPLGEE
jgi:hypothetical protein